MNPVYIVFFLLACVVVRITWQVSQVVTARSVAIALAGSEIDKDLIPQVLQSLHVERISINMLWGLVGTLAVYAGIRIGGEDGGAWLAGVGTGGILTCMFASMEKNIQTMLTRRAEMINMSKNKKVRGVIIAVDESRMANDNKEGLAKYTLRLADGDIFYFDQLTSCDGFMRLKIGESVAVFYFTTNACDVVFNIARIVVPVKRQATKSPSVPATSATT